MYYYDKQVNYLLLTIASLHCELFTMLIKGKLTVQVTSKGLCSSVSYSSNKECLAPFVGGLAINCPPPPLGPLSLVQGPRVTGKEAGSLLVISRLMLSQGFPTSLIHHNMTMQLSYLTDHPSPQEEHLYKPIEAGVQ